MVVKASRSERLLALKGNVFWYRQGVPKAVHLITGGPKYVMINLATADIALAKSKRDELEAKTRLQFIEIMTGRRLSLELVGWTLGSGPWTMSPSARGDIVREARADALAKGDEEEFGRIIEAAEAEADGLRPKQREAFEFAMTGRVRVDHYVEAYLKTAGLAPKTAEERKGLIGRFANWCGQEHQTLDRIDRRLAGRYVSTVLDEMHPATQRKHLTALRQYWIYLARRAHISLPTGERMLSGWPWNEQQVVRRGTRVERGAKRDKERPFKDAEVTRLLTSDFPLSRDWEALMKDALLISLLSGMRQAEIITLWAGEVISDEGRLFFDIQQGKTSAASRKVPVHSDLIEIVKARIKGKGPKEALFHELAGAPNPADKYGKRFKRWREALGVMEDQDDTRRSLVNFHSARRWFTTKARHADQSKDTIADIVGHKPDKRDMTFGTYTTGASQAQSITCVEAVRLPPEVLLHRHR